MKTAAIFAIAFLAMPCMASAHGHSFGRVYYGGGPHTSSHGWHFSGSYSGSSHKGGHYNNYRTSNRYGRHT